MLDAKIVSCYKWQMYLDLITLRMVNSLNRAKPFGIFITTFTIQADVGFK